MIDLDEITKLLVEKPHKNLYFGRKTGKIVSNPMEIIGEETPEDICTLFETDACWKMARKDFCKKHEDLFPLAPSSYPNKKFKEILAKEGLEKDWFYELRLALALPITQFSKRFSIPEAEATNPLYKQIKEQLAILEKQHYEKKYSDMVLFKIKTDYELVPFSILGNAGQTFGIGFYPDDYHGDVYWAIQNADTLSMDKVTMNSLIHALSFYFEKDAVGGFDKNPFGKSGHYTSLYISKGQVENCYLPKSMAVRALSFLEAINAYFPSFHKAHGDELADGRFYNVVISEEDSWFHEYDINVYEDGINPFRDVELTKFLDVPLKFDKDKTFSATFFAFPYTFNDTSDPDRLTYYGYGVFMCDEKTGDLVIREIGPARDEQGLNELVSCLSKSLESIKVAKKIYVNTYIDEYFFETFFRPYIEKKQMKLIVTPKTLATDHVMQVFMEDYMKDPYGEDDDSDPQA